MPARSSFRSLSAVALMLSSMMSAQPVYAQGPTPPRLLIVISVDQFSGDLFNQYRGVLPGGFKRLEEGAVFPRGYQSHAATETCPGHSTILTGDRPARTGIIANTWYDMASTRKDKDGRQDKAIYCAEDETRGASSRPSDYVPSPVHLKVPTLGDRMKAADPRSRVVSVAGKDRAAIMMGGAHTDEIWFLRPTDHAQFITLAGRTNTPASIIRANQAIDTALAAPAGPFDLGAQANICATRSRTTAITPDLSIGTGRFERKAGDKAAFRASPESDTATLSLASSLIADMRLGKGPATDLIAIGLSATDIVGHRYGTQGNEMCTQIIALDTMLDGFFRTLDAQGIDYAVALTADHGGQDAPERAADSAIVDASRVDKALTPNGLNAALAKATGLSGPLLYGDGAAGDIYLASTLTPAQRRQVATAALKIWQAHPQVAAVFTHDELAKYPLPSGPPDAWNIEQEARASFDPARSGDFVVLLKPRITPIVEAGKYIATHGSPWDYDRRVPILFWRKGMAGFEQPNSVETVDIMPTLAAMIGLKLSAGEVDGRCLDLDPGMGSTCK
ncbi:MAG: alkaline phosphatase family protein [Sphingobium sp.]